MRQHVPNLDTNLTNNDFLDLIDFLLFTLQFLVRLTKMVNLTPILLTLTLMKMDG